MSTSAKDQDVATMATSSGILPTRQPEGQDLLRPVWVRSVSVKEGLPSVQCVRDEQRFLMYDTFLS